MGASSTDEAYGCSSLVTSIPTVIHALRASPAWSARATELPPLDQLVRRGAGALVTNHRSSFVQRFASTSGDVFVKVYEYASWADRLRAFARRTGPWATPRPVREFDALRWLGDHGFAAPEPLFAGATRVLGFLARAVLITPAWPGAPASAVLPTLGTADRKLLAEAIRQLLRALHAHGFRDRNFDLRNLLVRRRPDGTWAIAKIDSPRFCLAAPNRDDARARADWRRLEPQLAAAGCPPPPPMPPN